MSSVTRQAWMRERTTAEMVVLDLLVGTDETGVRSYHRISVGTVRTDELLQR